jgi:hypothetical protein
MQGKEKTNALSIIITYYDYRVCGLAEEDCLNGIISSTVRFYDYYYD